MAKKSLMPATISVVILGTALSGCGTPNPTPDAGTPDAGLCPAGCGTATEADGGPRRSADGGIECFC